MVCLKTVRWGTALAALVSVAAAQTEQAVIRVAEAQQLRLHGRFAEARTAFLTLLHDAQTDHLDGRFQAVVLDNLGLVEQDSGSYAEAESAFNRGLAAFHATLPDDLLRVHLKTDLAELYIAEQRPDDAGPLLRQASAIVQSSPEPDPLTASTVFDDLAVVDILHRKFSEPETLLRQSQGILEEKFGAAHPLLAGPLLTLAGLLTAEHRYSEALVPAERAWQILRTTSLLIPKPYVASALSVLAAVYYHLGRTDEAADCAGRSVTLAEAALGPQHPRVGIYLENYALILRHAERKNEAKEIQRRADAILAQSQLATGGYTVDVAALR